MSVSDRAAAAERYLQTALDDPDVQAALQRAVSAGRRAHRRGRGKSPGKAVKDKRLRRRSQQAVAALCELIAAIESAQTKRKRRRGRRTMLAVAVLAGGYGVYLFSSGDGLEALRKAIKRDADS